MCRKCTESVQKVYGECTSTLAVAPRVHWSFILSHSFVRSFVRSFEEQFRTSFVRSFVCSFVRSFVWSLWCRRPFVAYGPAAELDGWMDGCVVLCCVGASGRRRLECVGRSVERPRMLAGGWWIGDWGLGRSRRNERTRSRAGESQRRVRWRLQVWEAGWRLGPWRVDRSAATWQPR